MALPTWTLRLHSPHQPNEFVCHASVERLKVGVVGRCLSRRIRVAFGEICEGDVLYWMCSIAGRISRLYRILIFAFFWISCRLETRGEEGLSRLLCWWKQFRGFNFHIHEPWCLGLYGRFLSGLLIHTTAGYYTDLNESLGRVRENGWRIGVHTLRRIAFKHLSLLCGRRRRWRWRRATDIVPLETFECPPATASVQDQTKSMVCMYCMYAFREDTGVCMLATLLSQAAQGDSKYFVYLGVLSICHQQIPTNFKPFWRGEDDGLDGEI